MIEQEEARTYYQRGHSHSNSINMRNEGPTNKSTDFSAQNTRGSITSSPYKYFLNIEVNFMNVLS